MAAFTTPDPLTPGAKVGVLAPSSGAAATARHIFELGLDRLRSVFDVVPVVHPTARQRDAYLRGHPEARAAAIHEFFADPEIEGIMATIGGNDQLRVLSHLDPEILRTHPTRFFGLSDNTHLSLYLWNLGIVSYTGVQLMSDIAVAGSLPAYTERYLARAFFDEGIGSISPASQWADMTVGWDTPREEYLDTELEYRPSDGWTWDGGQHPASGRIWGGCFSILMTQLMTERYLPKAVELDGAILAMETSEELPPAETVRQCLMAMGERGLLERFDGLMVARPATETWIERRPVEERDRYRREQRAAVLEQLDRYNPEIPVVFDVDFGHTTPAVPIPIGGMAKLVPGSGIEFTEDCG